MKRNFRSNLKPALVIMLVPLVASAFLLAFFVSGAFGQSLSESGNERLVTANWEAAKKAFTDHAPDYERKFAYYKLKQGQTLASVSAYFSVDLQTLTKLNPGTVVAGTTIKVPPVEHALVPDAGPNGALKTATVTDDHGLLRVRQTYDKPLAVTNIPELMKFLKAKNAIEQTGPTSFRFNRSISIEGNIRIDITDATVTKLELRSAPHDITCLCLDEASALIKNVEITTYDPATKQPDKTFEDERSFVRAKNGRMDAINTKFSYLGNDLADSQKNAHTNQAQNEGGTYGVSWRISDNMLGVQIATGWVENSDFQHNHFGAYSFGASGMTWRGNHFTNNEVYGLDPHDDSNNALIEDNLFAHNGKHGFIVSKRCDYNIIRNNLSLDNKLHGFMLHQDSSYNLIENNVSYGNVDNYVIFHSDYNTVTGNKSYNARSSHVRINEGSHNDFVTGNLMLGGRRGVYLYGGVSNIEISNNVIHVGKETLTTHDAQNVLFASNEIDRLAYSIPGTDRVIFGVNTIRKNTNQNIPNLNSIIE